MTTAVFEFDGIIINLDNVTYIKTYEEWDQVYMTIGMLHVHSKHNIKEVFKKFKDNEIVKVAPTGFPKPI